MSNNNEKFPSVVNIRKFNFWVEVLDWTKSITSALVLVVILFAFAFRIVIVEGTSMLPTLNPGNRLLINSLFCIPGHDDIVVLRIKQQTGDRMHPLIKRVIAVGGETVEINYTTNTVTVYKTDDPSDSRVLDEPYLFTSNIEGSFFPMPDGDPDNPPTSDYTTSESIARYPVPEGKYFVMGDNRNNSKDSRNSRVGFIPRDQIIGTVVIRIYPFESFGAVKPATEPLE